MSIVLSLLESPLGPIALAGEGACLRMLHFGSLEEIEHDLRRREPDAQLVRGPLPEIEQALRAYFDGDVHAIDALPTRAPGTGFQQRVWAALRRIPVGETWTYARLAREVGQPTAMRAVGAANGKNPIGLVVPCHRVVATGGKLGGYAGGLERKAWLLRHEGAHLA